MFQRLIVALTIGLAVSLSGTLAEAIPYNPPKAPKPATPKPATPKEPIDPLPLDMPNDGLELKVPAPEKAAAPVMAEPEVKSKPNLDYERLQTMMKAGEWEEANRLTSLILLTLGDRQSQGYLDATSTSKLPCGDLKTIDILWRYYTGGRSGLTVQAKIWNNMWGTTAKDAKKFEGRVGWYKGTLNPNPKSAQRGHMPLRPTGDGGGTDAFNGGWITAMPARLETCGLIAQRPPMPKKAVKAKKAGKVNPGKVNPGKARPVKAKPVKADRLGG
jgi:GUN4-like